MKNYFFLPLLFLSIVSHAQTLDSAAVLLRVDSLNAAVQAHRDAFQFAEALQAVGEAKALTEQYFGKSSPAFITSCHHEANIHWRMGNYEQAVQVCQEGLDLQLEMQGKENAEYARLLHMLATLELEMADYRQAEAHFHECLSLRENVFGKNSAEYAMSLNNLGNVYTDLGELDEAMACHLEARQIREGVLGTESFDYAMSLGNLGRLGMRTGEYEKSVEYLAEASAIVEKTKGRGHPLVSISANNIAIAFTQLGRYGQAEAKFQEALELVAGSVGKEHPQYAFALNDLGMLYEQLGLVAKAEECWLQSFEIKEKAIGREHNYTLVTLGNLAKIYQESGQLEKAAASYLELAEIYQKNYGSEHFDNLIYLNNLANCYFEMGDLAKADSLHRANLAVRQRTLGEGHHDCAQSRVGIARILNQNGQPAAAFEQLQVALHIYESSLGRGNPVTIQCRQDMAETAWEMGQAELALQHADTTRQLFRQHLVRSAKHLIANELQLKMASHAVAFDFLQSVRFQFGKQQNRQLATAYDDALFFKGMLLENALELENAMTTAPGSLHQKYLSWKALQRRLAESYSQPLADQSGTAELERRAEDLEKELLRNVVFRTASETVNWQQVQSQLAPGEAAIEFIHFSWKNPQPTDSVLYAALVLRPGWEAPRWVTLCEAKQLLHLLATDQPRRADYVSQLFENQQLYDLLWRPLERHLDGVERIYFSPSGILHRIPLAGIEISENETLGNRYALHQVGSTRQLVGAALAAARHPSAPTATIFGGINYEMDSTAIASTDEWLAMRSRSGNISTETTRGILTGSTAWKYLPWTEVEAKTLGLIFEGAGMDTRLLLGHHASEEAFRSLGLDGPSPRVLHVATHGYFFPDPARERSERGESVRAGTAFQLSEHPMIRSGLILAGANHAWTGGEPLENLEDGILTAYEVSQLDLRETELVVLSACETGLGDIEGNEGVYGLQRAFKIAGAHYVLMSLWQVPDFVTEELMTTFYLEWLEEGKPIPDAFRSAQWQVKQRHPEPYLWAGFVLVE